MRRLILIAFLSALGACSGGYEPPGPWPPLKDHPFAFQEYESRWPQTVEAGVAIGDQLLIADDYALFASSDGGREWRRLPLATESTVLALAMDAEGSELFAITEDGGEHRSSDGGETWTRASVYDRLPVDMEEIDRYWDGYSLYEAAVSPDLEHWVIVGFCEGFISHDGGESFERVTGNNGLGNWEHDDLCLSELIVDDDYRPEFASIDVVGRLASGEYVYAIQNGEWAELCSFDMMAILLDSVTECDDVALVQDNARLRAQSDMYEGAWGFDIDPDEAVFEQRHLPIREGVDTEVVANLIENDAGKHWFVSYMGIAASTDRGQKWEAQIGGMPVATQEAKLGDDEYVGIWDNEIFVSTDHHVWSRFGDVDYAYDFADLGGAALVASNSGLIRFTPGGNTEKVIDIDMYVLHVADDIVWADGHGWLAASLDSGASWVDAKVDNDSEWFCAETCLTVDQNGRSWEARAENGELILEAVGELFALGEEEWVEFSYAAKDNSLLVARVGEYEGDGKREVWISSDRARSWTALPERVQYIDHVVFPAPGTAFIEGAGESYWIYDGGARVESGASPVPVESGIACSPALGQVALETYDLHPDWPDEEWEYIVYTLDLGETWWTMRTEESLCPQD